MYKRKTYRFPNAIEVEEYHNGRYGAPGQRRQKRKKPTPEQVEKNNQRNKENVCRRKLREHFREGDYYVTLTYARDARPETMEEAKKDFSGAMRRIRRGYESEGHKLKWIRNIEVGSRGAWHIHLVINRIPGTDIIIQNAWTHGRVHYQMLYEKGGYRDLAKYMTKSKRTDPRVVESSYSTSRNIPIPEPKIEIVGSGSWKKNRKIPDGWYLDKESYWEGINPVTGYPCRHYTLLRTGKARDFKRRKKHEQRRDE